jgi:[acyl-carrier-protein] S-malonyltransferase
MGRDLAAADPDIAALYARANELLGFELSTIIFDGPEDELQQTPVQQPAILVTSIAYLTALRKRGNLPEPGFVAGHSLGEYAALVAADALDFDDAVRLVRRRGALMQEHGAGAMAAIVGMAPEDVAAVAQDTGVEVANFNAPDQTTISGRNEQIEAAMELAKTRGAKRAILLPVSAAFHSSLMQPAEAGMRPLLAETSFATARMPLIGNVDAIPLIEPDDLRGELVAHICRSVRWVDVIATMRDNGVTTYYEIGPDKVLAGLIARCDPEATVISGEKLLVND